MKWFEEARARSVNRYMNKSKIYTVQNIMNIIANWWLLEG